MTTVDVKRGDTGIRFSQTLTSEGVAVDLAGFTVTFVLRSLDGATVVTGSAVIDQVGDGSDGTKGMVHYDTVTGNLGTVAVYLQEWEAVKGAQTLTFPSSGYNTVRVGADLNPP